MQNSGEPDMRVTVACLDALQAASEMYITHFFEDSYLCTLHRGRVTLGVNDMKLIKHLRETKH